MNEDYKFDPMTGEPLEGKTEQPSYDAAPAYEVSKPEPITPKASKGKCIAGMSVAIGGLAFSWLGIYFGFFGIIPLAASIVGMILAKGRMPFQKVGKICGVFGIVLSVIFMILGFVFLGLLVDGAATGAFDRFNPMYYM